MRKFYTLITFCSFLWLISCSTETKESTDEVVTSEEQPLPLTLEEITYSTDSISMKGYLAFDPNIKEQRPGILVVHEWWGHNDYARSRAEMLAEMGYTALAVDMYGDGKTAGHPDDAGRFAQEVFQNIESAMARFNAAHELLQNHPTTNSQQIAAIGYCFGGGVVLHMARSGADLNGVVSFHGSLGTQSPAKAGTVKAAVLVCHGADDPFVSAESVEAIQKEMEEAEVDFIFKSYEGVLHSFTNPSADSVGEQFDLPLKYDAQADAQSWQEMQDFFSRIFQN